MSPAILLWADSRRAAERGALRIHLSSIPDPARKTLVCYMPLVQRLRAYVHCSLAERLTDSAGSARDSHATAFDR